MKIFDNIGTAVIDDLKSTISRDSRISIAASCFSIYAFQELRKELENIEELRFIFTSPTFTTDKTQKDKREFYIPRLSRERSLYGSEFELKLRNELSQKAIAIECSKWIKEKVIFKSNIQQDNTTAGFIHLSTNEKAEYLYSPISSFTTTDLGCDKGNSLFNIVNRIPFPNANQYLKMFDELWQDSSRMQDVTNQVIDSITEIYKENSPEFIYYITLYNIFSEFLEDISEDVLPNDATGFKESKIWNMLYNFQQDAVLSIISKLEKYNGCILADSVGLGKTFTALSVMKYYESKNKDVLVLCPKKLANNWNTYKDNYLNNPIASDRLNYRVLYHSDLSRNSGDSNGVDLGRLNWSNFGLVVIDESHNFRNGGKLSGEENEKENRYLKLLNKVIKSGIKTKVLMLSATPVNNRFNDLRNQLQLAYEGDSSQIDEKLDTKRSIDDIFKSAQAVFNKWSALPVNERTGDILQKMLDQDFFKVLDSVTIARSRKHIEKYYDTSKIGTFPRRLKPISLYPKLTNLKSAINYNQIFEELMKLNLSIYTPTHFILPTKVSKYASLYDDNKVNVNFTQANREKGIRRLTAINLMKRMESSVYSFRLTLDRIRDLINNTIKVIEEFDKKTNAIFTLTDISNIDQYDEYDVGDDLFTLGKKVKIDLADMDILSWKRNLIDDTEVLELLSLMVADISPEYDCKLQKLLALLENKIKNPINAANKKVIIFSAFADTAEYLYSNISDYIKSNFGLNTAMVTGSIDGRSTISKLKNDLNTVLTCFSPVSKDKTLLLPDIEEEIDILIGTDCISEGQNLQDCDYLINYDIHWNPVRIIQRFGRIDRIGSKNDIIQLVNFWPDISLDEYINLKSKVETRMKIVDMTATGDDNIFSDDEKMDLEYRKQQLQRLKEEVVDIEDMGTGVSIMDLGLNEFRLDLLEYIKNEPSLDKTPFGLHAVVESADNNSAGVIYVLRNRANSVNIDNKNLLHPFYMVYISDKGEVIVNHLEPKEILNTFRKVCKGKNTANIELCKQFNKLTKDGKDMSHYSNLLREVIKSVIDVKEKTTIDSFLSGENMSFDLAEINGLDDFELICFLVIK